MSTIFTINTTEAPEINEALADGDLIPIVNASGTAAVNRTLLSRIKTYIQATAQNITSAAATAFTVGPNGTTNPVFKVDASTASAATGVAITGAAAAGGVAVAVVSSGTNENLTIDAKGSGTVTVAGTSTGNVVVPRAIAQGTDATDRVVVKGIYMSPANVAVAVPSITDPDIAKVNVNVASAFSMAPAVGDFVIAAPQEALPTNARLQGAWVSATDEIELTFGSEGGNVTGANKNFKFLVVDVT